MSNIFGIIVAGRLMETNFVQTSETQFVINVDKADIINHVVVFLTGLHPFPDNKGGSVHIRWLKQDYDSGWHCLGFICNQKPSAIFKVAQLRNNDVQNIIENADMFSNSTFNTEVQFECAQIGISVEDNSEIESKIPAVGTLPSFESAYEEFVAKMLKNFVNYTVSFIRKLPKPDNPCVFDDYIPASVLHDWFSNFQRRLSLNPNFWKSVN